MHSKPKLLWIQGVTCNGNSHSFLNYPHLETLLENFTLLYHPILPSTETLETILACQTSCDILIFEGSYSTVQKRDGVFMHKVFSHYQKEASSVIALGSCASFGGVFYESDIQHNSGIAFIKETAKEKLPLPKEKLINIPGCPIHPEWLAYVLEMLLHNKPIYLDELYRPVELFSYLAHQGCSRNEYFEWKVDAKNFGEKEGCLYYEQGCRAPLTHAPCNKILWNEVNSKTRAGTPCFGCTENSFPRDNMFHTQTNMSIPKEVPLGVSKRSYLTITGIAKTFHIKRLEGKLIDYKKTHKPN